MRQGEHERKPVREANPNKHVDLMMERTYYRAFRCLEAVIFRLLSPPVKLARQLTTFAPRKPVFKLPLCPSFKMPSGRRGSRCWKGDEA